MSERTVGLLLLGFVMGPMASPAAVSGQEVDARRQDQAAIERLIEAVETANEAGDVDAWVDLFADDFVYMPPGLPAITTRDSLVETAKAGFRHAADIDIEPEEIIIAGDWAFARNRVTGTVTLAGSGEVVSVDVKQIVIYSREPGGDWLIARLIMNSNS